MDFTKSICVRHATWLMPFAALTVLISGADHPSVARSLDAIKQRGTIVLCAHPNALPFAAKKGDIPGFQVELGQAIAERLGVSLTRQWVINGYQIRRADCDIVLDAIGGRAALIEFGLRPSRPYQRSGVILAVREAETGVGSLADLKPGERVGVQVGSLVSMLLSKQGIETTPFAFEDEMMDALTRGEVAAAAVSYASVGYHNRTHPAARIRTIRAFEAEPDLNWDVAVGMVKPDDKLRQGIDSALESMLRDGTIARIYARYGIELSPPQ
jgi:polar amino acid transport system substrate-binding protein